MRNSNIHTADSRIQVMERIAEWKARRLHYSFLLQTTEHFADSARDNFERAIYVFLWNWSNWNLCRAYVARANILAERETRSDAMAQLNQAANQMRISYAELRDAKASFRRSKLRLVSVA